MQYAVWSPDHTYCPEEIMVQIFREIDCKIPLQNSPKWKLKVYTDSDKQYCSKVIADIHMKLPLKSLQYGGAESCILPLRAY